MDSLNLFKMIKIALLLATLVFTISIYSLTANDVDGGTIHFSDFSGKKILIVNTASNSSAASQYARLEELYRLYKDSLVIIAFPSNSFGNEPGNNQSIKDSVMNKYNIHFVLGEKINVTGLSQAPIYQWLTQESQNGMTDNEIVGDFQKFLVNKNGTLIGVFSPVIDPMDSLIQNAILHN
jgi:glutathione peroxidase